jgi:hypothetical protein
MRKYWHKKILYRIDTEIKNPHTSNGIVRIYVTFDTRCIAVVISTSKPLKMNLI